VATTCPNEIIIFQIPDATLLRHDQGEMQTISTLTCLSDQCPTRICHVPRPMNDDDSSHLLVHALPHPIHKNDVNVHMTSYSIILSNIAGGKYSRRQLIQIYLPVHSLSTDVLSHTTSPILDILHDKKRTSYLVLSTSCSNVIAIVSLSIQGKCISILKCILRELSIAINVCNYLFVVM
jgi:hypothetical protein